MSVETIQSSRTWKIIFNAAATVLRLIAAGGYAWEICSNVGVARLFMFCSLACLALVLLIIYDGAKGLYYLRATYLAVVLGTVVLFLKFMPNESLVVSVGDLNGSVSFIEPLVIFVVFWALLRCKCPFLGILKMGRGYPIFRMLFLA